jgi:hypothetical protein
MASAPSNFAMAFYNRGNALHDLKRLEEALGRSSAPTRSPPMSGVLPALIALVLFTGVVLLGRSDNGRIDDLPATCDVALGI